MRGGSGRGLIEAWALTQWGRELFRPAGLMVAALRLMGSASPEPAGEANPDPPSQSAGQNHYHELTQVYVEALRWGSVSFAHGRSGQIW